MISTLDEIKAALEEFDKRETEKAGQIYGRNNVTITKTIKFARCGYSALLVLCEDEVGNKFSAIAYANGVITCVSDWQAGSRPETPEEVEDYDWVWV